MKKYHHLVLLLLILTLSFTLSCTGSGSARKGEGKLQVITTIFPLYDFCRAIGGTNVNTIMLIPPGVEVHSYEPKPREITAVHSADLFFYSGPQLEVWTGSLIKSLKSKGPTIINASSGIKLLPSSPEEDHGHHDDDHASHSTSRLDPHFWLDPLLVKNTILTITSNFITADPANKNYYRNNSDNYLKELDKLHLRILSTLAGCRYRKIVFSGHFAFRYFTSRYNLSYISPYKGASPTTRPGAKDIAGLIKYVKENKINHIFFEELLEPRIADLLSRETGCSSLLLHAAHNLTKEDFEKGTTYLDLMDLNLDNLTKGLECTRR